jgi:hypothetical protein
MASADMRLVGIIGIFALAFPALASPPPPPPVFVSEAATILAAEPDTARFDRFADLFADDVVVYRDDATIAAGKPAWLALARAQIGAFHRRVIGYSLSSFPPEGTSGELLMIDEVDRVAPANIFADPRWETRVTLYQFGPDQLIHTVRIIQTRGFLQPGPDR